MQIAKISIEPNTRSYIEWLTVVPEMIQLEVESELPRVRRATKKEVQSHLTSDFGVDEGVYRRSFIINNYSNSKWEVAFQVYAKKPHYRLTHLLEDGHKTILFRWGKGRPTHITGAVGMSQIFKTENNYKNHKHEPGWTGSVEHIEPGQEYAEKELPNLYDKGINKVLKRGMIRIK